MTRLLNVSQAARELGRSADWLRDAEQRGKIPRAKRDPLNSWRVYTEDDVRELQQLLAPEERN